ncbi:MAG: hypothetical protein KGH63_01785, partial [Candidatus Micrarchaeota archaeon]|nr:hypothetical protein [Candidatus Micrarchaeota archaeon]
LPLSFAQTAGCGTAGTAACLDAHTLQVCGYDGNWTSQPCGANNHCSNGACVADCGAPGTYYCSNYQTVQVCGADGNWQYFRTCGSDQYCQSGQCIVPPPPTSGTEGRIGTPSSGTASSGVSGGNETPYPCVGWTAPIDGPNYTDYETDNQTYATRNCTNYTTISYCKMTTGQVDTGRTQNGSRVDCTPWSGGTLAPSQADAGAPPAGAASAASPSYYYAPASSPQPGQMGWALDLANQYGVFVAIPVGILIVVAIFMVLSMRGKQE